MMKLIGRNDSPFVRRVAVSLHVLGLQVEHLPLSPFSQAQEFRRYSPIGRMPSLVIETGDVLTDSAAILDYLDDNAQSGRELLPKSGENRMRSLQIVSASTAAADKAVAITYERRRPVEKVLDDWIVRCRGQLDAALQELESFQRTGWPSANRLMQADITTATMLAYVQRVLPEAISTGLHPLLCKLASRCEADPAFLANPQIVSNCMN